MYFGTDVDGDNGWIKYTHSDKAMAFRTNASEAMRIDSSGRLLIGASSDFTSLAQAKLQINGSSNSYALIGMQRNDTSVASDNTLGQISYYSKDGGTSDECARIRAASDAVAHTATSKGTKLQFYTTTEGTLSLTERMRIRNNGQSSQFSATSLLFKTERTGAVAFISFQSGATTIDNGTQKCRILADGDLENTNNSYGALSDVKLKENIVDAESQWEDLKGINIRNYNFKEELGFGTNTHIGVVAQELELVSPNLVKTIPDRDNDDNDLGTTTKSVKYSVLYIKAVKALQEAMERIENLEQRLTDAGIA